MAQPLLLARRPGYGQAGQSCNVLANNFLVRLHPKTIIHYDVEFNPDPRKPLKRLIFDSMVVQYKMRAFMSPPVFDGERALYSEKEIPLIELVVQPEPGWKTTYRVTLKEVSRLDMRLLDDYVKGKRGNFPQELLHLLELVTREGAIKNMVPVGRSFYSDKHEPSDIGGGVEAWKGFFMSLRPIEGYLALTVDMKVNAFCKEQKVMDYIMQTFRLDLRDLNQHLRRPGANGDGYRAKLKSVLKSLKLQTTHGNRKLTFKVSDLTRVSLQDLTFEMNGTNTSVTDYFKEKYKINFQFGGFPAVNASRGDRKKYIPLELCTIVKGHNLRKVSEQQYNNLAKISCCDPETRKMNTVQALEGLADCSLSYTRSFGVEINRNLTNVPARILQPPKIQYGNGELCPSNGSWNMINKRLVRGREVKHWGIISFTPSAREPELLKIAEDLSKCGDGLGMGVNRVMAFKPVTIVSPDRAESEVRKIVKDLAERKNVNLELLICVLPTMENKPLYARIKKLCELQLGVLSQCAKERNIKGGKPRYFANLLLKINTKLGGTNAVIAAQDMMRDCRLVSESPTMIIGVDVSHPGPGNDISCSTAAVVGSLDWPSFSQYETVLRNQPSRQEMVDGLYSESVDEQGRKTTGGIFKDLLTSFNRRTNLVPQRIIYYRDGVSDGEFQAVLCSEFEALQQACRCLGWLDDGSSASEPAQKRPRVPDKGPKITFIVVQKRHHTRFFRMNTRNSRDNVQPGTVVDKTVCHPTNFDFYLCSHQGIKGTSRPVHYHVLKDENGFTADQVQQFTHDLCYLYSRCTRSVSYVPPCYYAHLAAQRAQTLMDSDDYAGTGSACSEASSSNGHRRRPFRELPSLHENIRKTMFYI